MANDAVTYLGPKYQTSPQELDLAFPISLPGPVVVLCGVKCSYTLEDLGRDVWLPWSCFKMPVLYRLAPLFFYSVLQVALLLHAGPTALVPTVSTQRSTQHEVNCSRSE